MADVIIKLKVMPTGTEIDLKGLAEKCKKAIEDFGGRVHSVNEEPVAFGLKALIFVFLMDEKIGDTEKLEAQINSFPDTSTVDVIDVRRAFG